MYRRQIFITLAFVFILFNTSLQAQDEQSTNLQVLEAMMHQNNGDFAAAIEIYKKLYDSSKHKVYLKEAIKLALMSGSPQLEELLKKGESVLKDDGEFVRIKAMNLAAKQHFIEARELLSKLVTKEPSVQNITMLGTVCLMQNDANAALKYFEEAYKLAPSEESLLRIIDVLVNRLNQEAIAVRYLEDYRTKEGCTPRVCEVLAEIYSQSGNFARITEIYEDLYALTNDKSYLDKALQILLYEKKYKGAANFLKKYSYNDAMLMEIYASTQNFGDAYVLAGKLYNQTRNLDFLAKMAMYEYEMHSKNMTPERLKSIMQKFEDSVPKLNNAIYLNYYGYLLIDHDIDARKGVELVSRALELEPDSPYYQDSLAWGYFKLGECKRAKEYMLKAMKDAEFSEAAEAKEHLRLIERCIINLNKRLKK